MDWITWSVLIVGAVGGALYGLATLPESVRFLRFVERSVRNSAAPSFFPRAVVLLPCKGADTHLLATLRAVRAQDYPDYEVICAVESERDPAFSVIAGAVSEPGRVPMRCVVARRAEHCAQKIENLLAAIAAADPRGEIFVFVDSDAVPPPHWLASLVAPLADESAGASTGFRFYVSTGGWVRWARSLWNVAAFTFLGEQLPNFCWGGSTAIRRTTFEQFNIAARWRRALSEDYEITRALHESGRRIHFVPRCVIPSDDDATWPAFLTFARRQLIITRVAKPGMFLLAVWIATIYNVGGWALLILAIASLVAIKTGPLLAATALYAILFSSAAAKGWMRQRAVAHLFPNPAQRRWMLLGDTLGAPLIGLLHQGLMFAAMMSNRFWWRGIRYEMRSLDDVRILERRDASAQI